jgi:phage protein U
MAAIASWGGITFKVNSDQVFSFQKMKRTYSGRWASHSIIGKRPKMEFQGPGMDEISLEIILDAELGVKPRATMKLFRSAAKKGTVAYFYVGGKKVAKNKFYISSGTENWNEIWNQGELVRATASITFGEYR